MEDHLKAALEELETVISESDDANSKVENYKFIVAIVASLTDSDEFQTRDSAALLKLQTDSSQSMWEQAARDSITFEEEASVNELHKAPSQSKKSAGRQLH